MMNRVFASVLLCLLAAPAFAADKDKEYLALVDAAMTDPKTAKWCEIRQMYPDTTFYRALGNPADSTLVPEMGRRVLMERTKEAVRDYIIFSREHFGSINAHRYAAYLYKWHMELVREGMEKVLPDFGGKVDYIDFEFEKLALRELLKCVVSTGDGRGVKTAYHTITGEEQRILIEQYFHVDATGGDIKSEGGEYFSVVNVQIPDGPKTDLFFRLDPRMVDGIRKATEKK